MRARKRDFVSLTYGRLRYAVGGTVAATRPEIGNILRTSGSKGEAIKGVTLRDTVSRA